MLSVIKNDWYRMKEQRRYLYVALALTICSVIFAVVLTDKLQTHMNLAVVGDAPRIQGSSMLDITCLKKEPALSSLIQGRYDAVLTFEKDGQYKIKTVRSDDFKESLESVISGKGARKAAVENSRKIGTNILGYMLMFLLMQGVLYARLFTEDKEKHQIERIVCSPVPFSAYLAGHVVFIWTLIFVPSMLVITLMHAAGTAVGFALWQYFLILALLSLLSTCFAMCLNSFFRAADTANMVGSCIVVLTSVLSGTFYDCGDAGSLLDRMLYLIPQKNLILFADAWEKHGLSRSSLTSFFYVILCTILFLCIGIGKTRKDYIYHRSR